VRSTDLALDFWDETRYRALERRSRQAWTLLQELYAESGALAVTERALVNTRMRTIEDELCVDFREMVGIYEKAMKMHLPDHYTLYETCAPELMPAGGR
jgi:hypothetical protein